MNPKGSALPKDMKLDRYELLESLLITEIPISNVDNQRIFLEKYGHRLTSSSHLSELIPLILKREKDCVKSEISTKKSGIWGQVYLFLATLIAVKLHENG